MTETANTHETVSMVEALSALVLKCCFLGWRMWGTMFLRLCYSLELVYLLLEPWSALMWNLQEQQWVPRWL